MSKPFEYGTDFFVTTDLYYNDFKFFDQLKNKKLKINHKEYGAKLGYFIGVTWKADPIPGIRAAEAPYINRDFKIGKINDGYYIGAPGYINNSMPYGSTVTIGSSYDIYNDYRVPQDYYDYTPNNMYYEKSLTLEQAIKSRLYYIDIFFLLNDISTGREYRLECDYRDQVHISILSDNPNDFGKIK